VTNYLFGWSNWPEEAAEFGCYLDAPLRRP
jgi:hypothetical protein